MVHASGPGRLVRRDAFQISELLVVNLGVVSALKVPFRQLFQPVQAFCFLLRNVIRHLLSVF